MTYRRNSRLQIIVFLSIALAGLWGFVVIDRSNREVAAIEAAELRMQALAHAYAENTQTTIKRIDIVSHELAHVWATDPRTFQAAFERLAAGISDISLQIAVVDAQGWLVFSNLGLPEAPMNLSDREHIRVHQGVGESRLFIGKPVVGRVSRLWSVQFTRPIIAQGKFDGVLIVSISPGEFGRFYQAVSPGSQAVLSAVREDGIILSQSPHWEQFVGKSIEANLALRHDGALQGKFRQTSTLDGSERIYGYFRLPEHALSLVASIAVDDVFARVRSEMKTVERLAGAASLLLLVVAVTLYRNLLLRERAESQVTALNKSLEKRVEDRTLALQRKEKQLLDALSLNHNILLSSTIGIAAYRDDGQCVLVNPSFGEIIGGSEAQMLRQNFREIASWKASGLLVAAEAVLASGVAQELKIHLRSTFGRELWMACNLARFESHEVCHLLLLIEDVTELVKTQADLEARERAFRSLVANVPDIIVRHQCDGRITYVNRNLEDLLGRAADDIVGRMPGELLAGGVLDDLDKGVVAVARSGNGLEFEQVFVGPEGKPMIFELRLSPEFGADGSTVGVLTLGRDITAKKMAVQQLRLAASVFQNSREGVVVTDENAVILSVNPAFTEITGYAEDEAVGRKTSLLRSDRHDNEFYAAMWQALLNQGHWQDEIWNRRKGGEAYLEWRMIDRIDDGPGTPVRYASVFHDITELRQKDERIRHMAFHDALTGLPNRALFQERLEHALHRLQRKAGGRLSVTFIDLDGFKEVNDTLGHDVGDQLLQEVGKRIRAHVRRRADTVARLGGDEFVVLMEDLETPAHCASMAEDLIQDIAQPIELSGQPVCIGASMGIAFFPEDGRDAQTLMKRADSAMYAAKQAGKGQYRVYSST